MIEGMEDHAYSANLEKLWSTTNSNSADIASLKATVGGIDHKVDSVVAAISEMRLHLNRPANYTGIITACVGTLALLGSLAWTTITPLSGDIVELRNMRKQSIEREIEVAFERGQTSSKLERLLADTVAQEQRLKEINEHFLALHEKTAEGAVSRRAIGDYLREHANKQGDAGHPTPK